LDGPSRSLLPTITRRVLLWCQINPYKVDEDSIQIETFNLKIDNFSFCGLRFHEEVFITESEGLQVIGVRPDWLRNLDLTHRHLLKEKGFSFETEHFSDGLEHNDVELFGLGVTGLLSGNTSAIKATQSCLSAEAPSHLCSRILSFLIMWSVICTVSDNKVIYSLVQGEVPSAEFTGSRHQCLAISADVSRLNYPHI
jgi:hypothetical protein